MPLIIILVECGLELIPKKIRQHPAVKRNLSEKNYFSQILDNSLHHSAMTVLKNKEKRGRPGIAHVCMLNALGSALNKSGNLRLFIHTLHNKIFEINSDIRMARNFNRFKGLVAKLLIDGNIIVDGLPLISRFEGNLSELIRTFENPHVSIYSSKGRLIKNYQEMFNEFNDKSFQTSVAIIGGFQRGDFSKEILALSNKLVSISKYKLDAWVVVNKIINFYEISHKIH